MIREAYSDLGFKSQYNHVNCYYMSVILQCALRHALQRSRNENSQVMLNCLSWANCEF